ncbi:UNVERIFIED_CONTAM: hypothetical protein Slati_2440700 [Sesamum latifolium]|uniref:Uncharacterized protein n=1 Tax=Sesamum latifolium TaxID=2727402 RepID=A0AAW2WGP9_9LAMI
MKMTYWWDCDDESMFWAFHMFIGKYTRKTFSVARSSLVKPPWLANEIRLQLQVYWVSEGFQQESSKNKANRAANPTASSTMYRRDPPLSEAEYGLPPKQMEVFERCYKKKEDGGWRRPRVVEVADTFQKLVEDHQLQLTADDGHTPAKSEASVAMIEQQMWVAAIGGKNKGRVFGLDFESHFSNRTYTPPPPPPPPNPAQEDLLGRLEVMMADMMVMIREMRVSSSVAGPSQPIASSTALTQPTIDPQPPNDDEMGVLD